MVRLRALFARVLGAGSPLVAGRLVSAALTFALPLMLARLLAPHEFGTYKQFFLIAQTLQLTGQLGLTQSLYLLSAARRQGARRLCRADLPLARRARRRVRRRLVVRRTASRSLAR